MLKATLWRCAETGGVGGAADDVLGNGSAPAMGQFT